MTEAFIPSPSANGFHVGPLEVHVYGLMYVLAVAAAIVTTRRRWRKEGGDPDLCYEGARKKYESLDGEVGERLRYELGVINEMGFPTYFLVVWDFVRYAKEHRVLVAD